MINILKGIMAALVAIEGISLTIAVAHEDLKIEEENFGKIATLLAKIITATIILGTAWLLIIAIYY